MNCMYTTKAYLWDSARGRGTCCTRALGKRGSNLTAGVGKEGKGGGRAGVGKEGEQGILIKGNTSQP